ncbi:MAG TPA: MFS transporter [Thermomonospora sp.]|nr:MFS transporter [Thermomonospora sp.]
MSSASDTFSRRRAGTREWIGLAVVALPVLVVSFDLTALHLALPHLAADLAPSGAQQLWVLDIYGFVTAGFLITMGTLGDRIGRRRLLLAGGAAFGVLSVAAAYSSSAEMLIVTRALLGVAGATLAPSTLALISNMFHDPRQRGLAIGVWGSCFAAGGAVGPVVSGVLLEWFWWGSVLLLGVPVMVVVLIAGPLLLPEFRASDPGRLDLPSVLLSLAGILPLVYALKTAAAEGWQPSVLAALLAGLACGAVFVGRQRTLDDPLIDLRLFRHRVLGVGLGGMLAGQVVLTGFILVFTQYLQLAQGLSPLHAGLWMVPFASVNVLGSMGAPVLASRLGPGRAIAAGLVVMALGLVTFTLAQDRPEAGPGLAVAGAMLVSLGVGPLLILVTDMVVGAAPRDRSGAASSLSETFAEVGMALGVAALGALVTAVYRGSVADEVPPGAPAPVTEAMRDSLAGAVAESRGLPADVAAEVLEGAREAFATALSVAGYASIAVAVVLAVVTWVFLKPGTGADLAEEQVKENEPGAVG